MLRRQALRDPRPRDAADGDAEQRGEGRLEGVRIAQEMVRELSREIQVSAPFGKIELALQVVEALER
ncbi:MAG: hypothetical protein ACAI44_01500 [Candidatus Sericytochromatia bacterium]